jgi:pyruvate dehydrogenase E1 component
MVPFYIFYSMFGFQRIHDLAWAAGDSQARGFLIGATAGRTTLNGEGLQHQDGHSHLMATTIPNCVSYDPTYSFELATIIRAGMSRMFENGENVFYYITTMNENYVHPDMPEGVEEGIVKGLYPLKTSSVAGKHRVQLMSAGTIMREVEAAAVILERDYGVVADIWSMTSVNELARQGSKIVRHNMMNPGEEPQIPYVTQCLAATEGPIIAATDYMRAHTNQLREFMPRSFTVLGTDGFGRSDTRAQLREFFEVDRRYVVLAAMTALADEGAIKRGEVAKVMVDLGIDPTKPDPTTV